ncbi:hypothetical protein AB0N17_43440 [Streptomyces sp. NPDC051133]|uniref:hypothetical protein n=1 Tax=Streptomyces sp. NPDC051133 TaxID=3155521 RepID=UPI003429AEC1
MPNGPIWQACWVSRLPKVPGSGGWHAADIGGEYTAENAQQVEDDPQNLFTQACLHGLRARLCDDVDALDSYLPPQIAAMARKVAEALEVPQPATG